MTESPWTADGKQVFHETLTTHENGFVGFWLPRNLSGTLGVSGDAGRGSVPLSTGADAPTCSTTLQLA